MKKFLLILLISFGVFATSNAQTTSAPASSSVSKQKDKADKQAIAAQKKADKQAKALEKKQAKADAANTTAASDDANAAAQKKADRAAKALAKKQAKASQANSAPAAPQVQATTTPPTASVAKVKRQTTVVNPANTGHPSDKVISTDAKGRTIYQGPRGGKYYIDKNGNKVYVK